MESFFIEFPDLGLTKRLQERFFIVNFEKLFGAAIL